MLFSTSIFLFIFLPLILALYYSFLFRSRKLQNILLLLASLGFYAWGEPLFVFVMLGSILFNYAMGLAIQKHRSKHLLVCSIVGNLSVLFIFKYLSFSIITLNTTLHTNLFDPRFTLPIGISFFTFQAMSYVIDVYRQKTTAQPSLINLGLYISFFPQLIAGPIVRYTDIAYEIENRHYEQNDVQEGIIRFIFGLGKKVILANTFATLADIAFGLDWTNLSTAMAWLGAIAYTLQIYFDFSGYSDMAIGLGRMFGFHFMENFNYPYIANSITDFWRRWHISLSSWFRDYVYIPLGGNRVALPRWILNMSAVWLLTGLWHGANWTFIVWGLFYLILLVIEKLTGYAKHNRQWTIIPTLLLVIISWVLFRSDSIANALLYLAHMIGFAPKLIDSTFILYITNFGLYILIGIIGAIPLGKLVKTLPIPSIAYETLYTIFVLSIFFISICFIVKGTYNPFIYFNF